MHLSNSIYTNFTSSNIFKKLYVLWSKIQKLIAFTFLSRKYEKLSVLANHKTCTKISNQATTYRSNISANHE